MGASSTSELPAVTNVVQALARVQAEIGGVEKLSGAERKARGLGGGDGGINYAYRGIDQIAAAAQPLFGRHGVVISPTVLSSDVTQIELNGRPWTDTTVLVDWTIYGPGGVEDRITARTEGQGRDNSDKGRNKAMTGAFKNLLLRLLCIGDPGDDPDNHTYESDTHTPVDTPVDLELEDAIAVLARIKSFKGQAFADELRAAAAAGGVEAITTWALRDNPAVRAALTVMLDNVHSSEGAA